MSGLIGSAFGKALSDSATTIGGYMMKDIATDQTRNDKLELQRERLAAAAATAEANRQMRVEMAAMKADGKSADADGGGMSIKSISEGGENEGVVARRMGMTVPELRTLRSASDTGNMDSYKKDVYSATRTEDPMLAGENGEVSDAVSRKYSQLAIEAKKELPAGFDTEIRDKFKALATIEESAVFGKNYKNVAEGRQTQQEVDASNAAIAEPKRAGIIGQGIAAGQGKATYGGDASNTRNLFTGETNTTEVGRSQANENNAQAGKATAEAKNVGNTSKSQELSVLQQERIAIDTDLKLKASEIATLRREQPKNWQADVADLQKAYKEKEKAKTVIQERLTDLSTSERDRVRPNAKADPAAPKPSDNTGIVKSEYKIGDTRKITSGPNAGKTARWDGRGWLLAN